MRGVDLSGRDLSEAIFLAADLTAAVLKGTILRKAVFSRGSEQVRSMQSSDLTGADLTGAKMVGFSPAVLRDASFKSATLNLADMSGSNLLHVGNVKFKDISGADFSAAVLPLRFLYNEINNDRILCDANTKFNSALNGNDTLEESHKYVAALHTHCRM